MSKCLQKDPRDRYPTAQTLATDLDLFVRETGGGVGRDSVSEIMNVLFESERRRADEWYQKSTAEASALPPLRQETTALLMQNMPSLPPPPNVDLWLSAPPPGFTGRAQPASERVGADVPVLDSPPRDSESPSPSPNSSPHVKAAPRRISLGNFQVAVIVAGLLVLALATIFVIRLLRSS